MRHCEIFPWFRSVFSLLLSSCCQILSCVSFLCPWLTCSASITTYPLTSLIKHVLSCSYITSFLSSSLLLSHHAVLSSRVYFCSYIEFISYHVGFSVDHKLAWIIQIGLSNWCCCGCFHCGLHKLFNCTQRWILFVYGDRTIGPKMNPASAEFSKFITSSTIWIAHQEEKILAVEWTAQALVHQVSSSQHSFINSNLILPLYISH